MTAWLVTFHTTWSEIAIGLMAVSGGWMVRDMWRHHRALRRSVSAHPANRVPYDWARDTRLRQAITCRKAS